MKFSAHKNIFAFQSQLIILDVESQRCYEKPKMDLTAGVLFGLSLEEKDKQFILVIENCVSILPL